MQKKGRKAGAKGGDRKQKKEIPREYLGRKVSPVALKIPLAYLRILTEEAERAGLRRGHFLTQLLQWSRGEIKLGRSDTAPSYQVTDDDLKATKLWLWYMSKPVRAMVDEDRLQRGISSISMWVTQTLNDWIGKHKGLHK